MTVHCRHCGVAVTLIWQRSLAGEWSQLWAARGDEDEWTCPVTGEEHEPEE